MNLPNLQSIQNFTKVHSPEILTGLGVTSIVSTGVLAFRAGRRVGKDENAGHYEPLLEGGEPETINGVLEWLKIYGVELVPPVLSAVTGITAVCFANKIQSKRALAAYSAYAVLEQTAAQYKDKVVEILGEKKEQGLRDEIAAQQVQANPQKHTIIVPGDAEILCYETFTGRYFKSTVETLHRAENAVNREIIHSMYASLNDFFREIGLDTTGSGEDLGWNLDKPIALQLTSVLDSESKPALSVGYSHPPFPDFYRIP